ncbi:hypothetical protein HDU83_003229 [Entophlyctis luteolus]|nr:hypothetical protein HDU82_000386 [Entophlyctis luteolus]KAJ3355562.1 hypothetical protein HDU83_003229 [Entophlyctis luteolus]KAJ3393536.1 hypothetical protein HDU84_001666 [Entophlyctis sp. JEL0112]
MVVVGILVAAVAGLATAFPYGRDAPDIYTKEWIDAAKEQWYANSSSPTAEEVVNNIVELVASFVCPSVPFPCSSYNATGSPADVRHVRPADISTVMAIGDSITAGFVMTSTAFPFGTLAEYRGLVFDIGGDSGAITVPNFLKVYNAQVAGAATGTTALKASIDVLDAAVSGAEASGLTGQIATLTSAFDSAGYSQTGWKMINVLIGANDICNSCSSASTSAQHTPAVFETGYRDAIAALRANFTNVIVNAITLFNVSQVYALQQTSSSCQFTQALLNECPCTNTAANRAAMDENTVAYNNAIRKVASEFSGFADFAVNVQSGVENLQITSLNYLSQYDCFHPNLCANQLLAEALWNNMFESAGQKSQFTLDATPSVFCPGPTDYLQ